MGDYGMHCTIFNLFGWIIFVILVLIWMGNLIWKWSRATKRTRRNFIRFPNNFITRHFIKCSHRYFKTTRTRLECLKEVFTFILSHWITFYILLSIFLWLVYIWTLVRIFSISFYCMYIISNFNFLNWLETWDSWN